VELNIKLIMTENKKVKLGLASFFRNLALRGVTNSPSYCAQDRTEMKRKERKQNAMQAHQAEAFLLNPQPLSARIAHEWGVVAEVVQNGKALSRARELGELYLKAPEVTRRNTRVHFIQPLKERIVGEVGYGLSLEGASAADLVKSKTELPIEA